jgi:hypothetical protein
VEKDSHSEKQVQERLNAVREVFSKPVALEMTDFVSKIRQNLMLASTITVAILFLGVQAAESQSFFGLTLQKLSTQKLKVGLLAINTYMLVHFVWLMFDAFHGWRIRLTGSGILYSGRGAFQNNDFDYVNDPQQSSLHNWWQVASRRFPSQTSQLRLEHVVADLENYFSTVKIQDARSPVADAIVGLNRSLSEIKLLRTELGAVKDVLESPTPPVALERFDNAYRLLLKSQSTRWLLLEVGLPVLLGASCVLRLSYELFWMHTP